MLGNHSFLQPIAPEFITRERVMNSNITPRTQNGAIRLIAGRGEDVAKINRLPQQTFDLGNQAGV